MPAARTCPPEPPLGNEKSAGNYDQLHAAHGEKARFAFEILGSKVREPIVQVNTTGAEDAGKKAKFRVVFGFG